MNKKKANLIDMEIYLEFSGRKAYLVGLNVYKGHRIICSMQFQAVKIPGQPPHVAISVLSVI